MAIVILSLLFLSTPQINAESYGIDLEYLGLDGQMYPFSKFSGKFLLVDTMATWCGPCIESIPHLKEVQELRKDVLSVFSLSVSPSSDDPETLSEFVSQQNATWEFGIDKDLVFQSGYQIQYIPTYLLFDTDGNLLKRFNVEDAQNTNDILDQIDPFLPGNLTKPNFNTKSKNPLDVPEIKLVISSFLLVSMIVVLLRMIRKIKMVENQKI